MPPNSPNYGPPPPLDSQPQPDYSFLNESRGRPKRFNFHIGSSIGKTIFIGICLILMVIVIIVIKNLLTTKPFSNTDYLAVIYKQQQIIHIVSADINQSNFNNLSLVNQNFVETCKLSVGTAQTNIANYLSSHGTKVNSKLVASAFSASLDNQLSQSLVTNTFNQTFSSIMNNQLTSYENDLSTAFKSSTGHNGRSMLRADYAGAQLLLKSLNAQT